MYTRRKLDRTEIDELIALVRSCLETWLRESALAFGNRQVIDAEFLR